MEMSSPAATNQGDIGLLPSTETVAAVVAGLPTIGEACAALRATGWRSTIAGNRITVNDRVFARFVESGSAEFDGDAARWLVYGIGDRPRIRIVRAKNIGQLS